MSKDSLTWSRLPGMVARLAAFDQSPVVNVWVDDQAVIGFASPAVYETLGFDAESLPGGLITLLAPNLDTRQWSREWWPGLQQSGKISPFPVCWRHQDGCDYRFPTSLSLVRVSGLEFAQFSIWPEIFTRELEPLPPVGDEFSLLDDLGTSVCIIDGRGEIVDANRALCDILGASREDLRGQSLVEWLGRGCSSVNLVRACVQQNPAETEFEYTRFDGETCCFRMNAVPREGAGAAHQQRVVSLIDITELRRVSAKLELRNGSFERLASNIPGFIYMFRLSPDGSMAFPYASQGCKDIFGVDPADVVEDATPIAETIHPDYQQLFLESVLESARTMEPWNFEARLTTKEGRWKWFHAASRPELQGNGDIIWEGLVMDVSTRKKVESELAVAKEEAEASARVRAEFLANMSHEIRTPLNGIIGLTRLVLKTDLNPLQMDYLKKVQSSSELLLGIINGILDFSRIESGKLSIERIRFQVDSVLQQVGSLLEPKAAEKGLEFLIQSEGSMPRELIGDPLRLQQILINLCSNAIKFTRTGEVILSVVEVKANDNTVHLRFSVRDTGIGLSEAQQSGIFDAFTQADSSTTRQYGGTGLGLAICRHLTTLMGGEIGVNSKVGEGSEFYFQIEFPVAVAARLGPVLSDDLLGRCIVLAGHNDAARRILSHCLDSMGFDTVAVHSGVAAISELSRMDADTSDDAAPLVILDYEMPGMDGLQTIEKICAAGVPVFPVFILMISAFEVERIDQSGQQERKIVWLQKPATASRLFDAIVSAVYDDGEEAQNQGPVAALSVPDDAVGDGRRVLLVEDNGINQEVARRLLESAGLAVDVAENGRLAVEQLQAQPDLYDAVLMDLQMPEMDGFEATRLIRGDQRFDALPVIAMTAHALESEKHKCEQAGMQDHVSKPIDPGILFDTLTRWIGNADGDDDAESAVFPQSLDQGCPGLESLTRVNTGEALQMLGGDESLLISMLTRFCSENDELVDRLRKQIETGEVEEAAKLTHQIKGVAGNLKIDIVYVIIVEIERGLKVQDWTDVCERLDVLSLELQTLGQELDAFNAARAQIAEQTIVRPLQEDERIEIGELLQQLTDYLESNDLNAEVCAHELKQRLQGHCRDEMDRLLRQLASLDYPRAVITAGEIGVALADPVAGDPDASESRA